MAFFMDPGAMFLGCLNGVEQKFLIELIKTARRSGYTRFVEPCAGTFAMANLAVQSGFKPEQIETSDVNMMTSVMGYAITGQSLEPLQIKETGRQEGGKMNNHWCKVSAMVCITAEDVDLILYEALNAGGISAWSDAVKTVGDKLGKRVCEQVALGGELMIHEIGGEWHKLSWQNLMSGVEQYLNESCHIRIEDERLALDDLTTNEADVIVQFALFGETKF